MGEVAADLSGRAQFLFRIPAGFVGDVLGFQAFEQAPAPETSKLVYTARTARLVSSMEPAGATLVVGASTVQFTVTFHQPVIGLSESDFVLAARNVSGARISGLTGRGTTYAVTVETGTGDGILGLNLQDETGIATATGVASDLTRNGSFTGRVFTIHKTREDVDLDFTVTAQDALVLINAINRKGGPFVPGGTALEPVWHDVNSDEWVSALDVLLIVNYVNGQSVPAGEGESAPRPVYTTGSFNPKPQAMVGLDNGEPLPKAACAFGCGLQNLPAGPGNGHADAQAAAADEFDPLPVELEDVLTDIAWEVGRAWQDTA